MHPEKADKLSSEVIGAAIEVDSDRGANAELELRIVIFGTT
jgi:hypothetical protein